MPEGKGLMPDTIPAKFYIDVDRQAIAYTLVFLG